MAQQTHFSKACFPVSPTVGQKAEEPGRDVGTGHSLGSAQFATGQEMNFPDTTALDPACFPSGDIRDFCATTSRASAAGFPGDSWGRDSSGGMAEPSS